MLGFSTDEVHPYVATDEIGRGGFATVYSGYHKETRGAVAIKTISRSTLTLKLMDRLESEVNILKTLKYRHIVELADLVISSKHVYLIMELCPGGDLLSYIKHRGRVPSLHTKTSPLPSYLPHPKLGGLSDPIVRSFTGQLASAVKFLRDRDLIHRDIKPQNILLSPANSVAEYICSGKGGWIPGPVGTPVLKIGDFGLAKVLPSPGLADTLCGSPLYMAPEITCREKYDAKVDLWSIGAVVYEMAAGHAPFRAQTQMELMLQIDHARNGLYFPDEDSQNADDIARGDLVPVSEDVKSLTRSLLRYRPDERLSFGNFFDASEKIMKLSTPSLA